ncbi:MAG: alpha-2-macroglobulin family protein [Ignavibacterium sp.]|jgi:hypothetical protein|nr:alpha-2-macroglobulin family protein [Ignavibacterium sp.]
MAKINFILWSLIISLLLVPVIISQTTKSSEKFYNSSWEKADSLERSGLTRSALKVVEEIFASAKKEKQYPQYIKAVLFKLKFANYVEENSHIKIVNEVKKEIQESSFPSNAILKSILADMFWEYYKNNRYKFLQRTETVNFGSEDFSTWDLNRIIREITKYYLGSIEDKEKLQNISLEEFEPILINQDSDNAHLRPTLFDLLTHKALAFFISEESALTQPVYKFVLNNENDFAVNTEFIKNVYTTKDSLSLKFYAIQLYQKLIEFHLSSGNNEALLDVDIARLNFVKQISILKDKNKFYFRTLQNLAEKQKDFPHSSLACFYLAQYYKEEGNKYNPDVSDEFKWHTKKALQICDSIAVKYPKTIGTYNCLNLKIEILSRSISLQIEKANLPSEPFRVLVSYKNIEKLYMRVIDLNDTLEAEVKSKDDEQMIKIYTAQTAIKEWSLNLPVKDDYQNHKTEIVIPSLPVGKYLIMAATDSNFTYIKNGIAYCKTWVTNLSFIRRSFPDNFAEIMVLDRKTGEPISDVNIELYNTEYNQRIGTYQYVKSDSGETDSKGRFKYKSLNYHYYSNYKVLLVKDNDEFDSEDNYDYRYSRDKELQEVNSALFLDRAIYRPGQIVYFKGLMYKTDYKKDHDIISDKRTTVTLYDNNKQKIADTTLTTNEFGTFNGQLTIPFGRIGGNYSLSNEFTTKTFKVEEYKRPKFEVKFEPIKGSYALNEKISVTGFAKTFSGANLNDVEVKFRVSRITSFPFYNWRYRNYYNWYNRNYSSTEIVNGTIKTDNEGKFIVEFDAIPDLAILRETNPIFNYSVYVDVVDATGETRSAQTNIKAGYVAINIYSEIPEIINQKSNDEYAINTINLNGQFEPAEVFIEVYKLKTPERVFRNRLWSKPDSFILSESEFYKTFEFDVYNDENEYFNWEKDSLVYQTNLITKENSIIRFDGKKAWYIGKYLVNIKTKDKNGIPVEITKYFTLFNPDSKEIPLNNTIWVHLDSKIYQPGDTARLYFGSALKNVKALFEIEQDGKLFDEKLIEINNEQKIIEIEIEEKHRGNIAVSISLVINNENFLITRHIMVPWTNKKLDITVETFRDKITPGVPEKWSFKILDFKGKNADAEFLASMYDASLNQFAANNWYFNVHHGFSTKLFWNSSNCFSTSNSSFFAINFNEPYKFNFGILYPQLDNFGFSFYGFGYRNKYIYQPPKKKERKEKVSFIEDSESDYLKSSVSLDEVIVVSERPLIEKSSTNTTRIVSSDEIQPLPVRGGRVDEVGYIVEGISQNEMETAGEKLKFEGIAARKNLNETAFFFPELRTNKNGEVIVSFTTPETLTRWKFMGFSHTKDLEVGFITKETVTKKDLMIQPNPPRFLREGDEIYFTAKVSNLSDDSLSGSATLQLFDAFTMQPVDNLFENNKSIKSFSLDKNMSEALSWRLKIPTGITEAIVYRVLAKSDNFSDGEENALPILTNRMLVIETLPLPVNANQTKSFVFDKLKNNTSTTLQNYNLTLEFTSNPAWYAIQALPYLMEYPYECSEQIFSRYYANSIAGFIANSNPKIKKVFDSWKTTDKDALLSNLEKNQELKYALLEETPWVLEAQNESVRKRNIGLLFDLVKMSDELKRAEDKLKKLQYSNGGWPWFEGLPESNYITQYIVAGIGHLERLGINNFRVNNNLLSMLQKAISYIDLKMYEEYKKLKNSKISLYKKNIGYSQIHYLYGRSYFNDIPVDKKYQEAFDYWKNQAEDYWLSNNKYMQGMIALALYRFSETEIAGEIIKSIIENAVMNDEMGMYFKEERGWYWYQAPIETQALLIEAVDEITNDQKSVDLMKTWLLKNKQTNDWKTTTATANACYALLLRGTEWLAETQLPDIKIGDEILYIENKPDLHIEQGTGYFKTSWKGDNIKPEMADITVTNKNNIVSWGALYWQYFEQLDKITFSETPLKINKKLFLEIDTESGKKITPIDDNTELNPGDKIIVRIEIRVDRSMEYIHLKDMRAAGLEPINVLSTHKHQDGLWYYENTKDAATNFFIYNLPAGTYVFEYPLRATYKGNFSNGITSIQCMYAPEFSSHSEGSRISIK